MSLGRLFPEAYNQTVLFEKMHKEAPRMMFIRIRIRNLQFKVPNLKISNSHSNSLSRLYMLV